MSLEGTPRGISKKDAAFTAPKPRLVPVVTFVPETTPVSLEERIERGRALLVIGMLELMQARDELVSKIEPLDRLLGIRRVMPDVPVAVWHRWQNEIVPGEVLEPREGESLNELMVRYRIEAGLSQAQLVRRGELDASVLSRLERRKHGASHTTTIQKWARGLGWADESGQVNVNDPRYIQVSVMNERNNIQRRQR